jgi:hypothetical protein
VRILLAEDGPDNQSPGAQVILLRKAGAEVEIADNGQHRGRARSSRDSQERIDLDPDGHADARDLDGYERDRVASAPHGIEIPRSSR